MKFNQMLRDWALIIAMVSGVVGYLLYARMPWLDGTHAAASTAVAVLQPMLIFAMLFVTFCRIKPRQLRLCRWHLWMLLIQGGAFVGIGLALIAMPHSHLRVVLEGAMICLICPTATAAPVITKKLGGNVAHITTYTLLINTLAAVLIPAMMPYVHPMPGMSVAMASAMIMGKVFPLLILPLVMALLLRWLAPRLCHKIGQKSDVSFYLWVVALALAMAVTTRSIAHSSVSVAAEGWLVAVSLASCIFQFWCGWRIGARYDDKVTAGQAFGQKNTVLAIWLGYTFFTPITSIAGGFYSIWHNVINSWQLYHHRRLQEGHKA